MKPLRCLVLKGKASEYVTFDEECKYFVVTLKYEKAKAKPDERKMHKLKGKKKECNKHCIALLANGAGHHSYN